MKVTVSTILIVDANEIVTVLPEALAADTVTAFPDPETENLVNATVVVSSVSLYVRMIELPEEVTSALTNDGLVVSITSALFAPRELLAPGEARVRVALFHAA